MTRRLDTFLRVAADQRASDLHFHAGKPPMVRYYGELIPLPFRILTEDEARRMLEEILSPAQREALERDQEIDFAYVLEGVGRFRANVFVQAGGLGGVFRVIPSRIPTMEDLRLPAVVRRFADLSRGLVLVTGPTGSGKTTTLASLIQEINRTREKHVISIEDPIEFVHVPEKCAIHQREIGAHTESFHSALRSALREAPDVLIVGEMRDYETVHLALAAAETGVLVLGTLHTNSAAKAIDRLLGACPSEVQAQVRGILSVLLKAVLAQRLCRLASGEGRIAAVEVLLQTQSMAHLIRENKVHLIDAYLRTGEHGNTGMCSLERSLFRLVREGLVSSEEAAKIANDPETFAKMGSDAAAAGGVL